MQWHIDVVTDLPPEPNGTTTSFSGKSQGSNSMGTGNIEIQLDPFSNLFFIPEIILIATFCWELSLYISEEVSIYIFFTFIQIWIVIFAVARYRMICLVLPEIRESYLLGHF